MRHRALVLSGCIFLILFLVSCSTGRNTPTNSVTSGATTYGQAADAAKPIFSARCAKCHGNNGEGITGPTLIGAKANLAKYNTAQGLLNFISTSMPFDAPGTLSQQEYLNLVAFLVTQNNYASAATAFDSSQLSNLSLKR